MKSLPNIPKHPLNDQFKRLGITRIQLAAHLSRPVSTVSAWLNGYSAMPPEVEKSLGALLQSLGENKPIFNGDNKEGRHV